MKVKELFKKLIGIDLLEKDILKLSNKVNSQNKLLTEKLNDKSNRYAKDIQLLKGEIDNLKKSELNKERIDSIIHRLRELDELVIHFRDCQFEYNVHDVIFMANQLTFKNIKVKVINRAFRQYENGGIGYEYYVFDGEKNDWVGSALLSNKKLYVNGDTINKLEKIEK